MYSFYIDVPIESTGSVTVFASLLRSVGYYRLHRLLNWSFCTTNLHVCAAADCGHRQVWTACRLIALSTKTFSDIYCFPMN